MWHAKKPAQQTDVTLDGVSLKLACFKIKNDNISQVGRLSTMNDRLVTWVPCSFWIFYAFSCTYTKMVLWRLEKKQTFYRSVAQLPTDETLADCSAWWCAVLHAKNWRYGSNALARPKKLKQYCLLFNCFHFRRKPEKHKYNHEIFISG